MAHHGIHWKKGRNSGTVPDYISAPEGLAFHKAVLHIISFLCTHLLIFSPHLYILP